MLRKLIIALVVALVFLSSTALAYSVPDDTIVYVTPTGEKYHRKDCSYIGSVRSLTIAMAESAGYTPCSRCNPDILTGEYVSDWDGERGGSSRHTSNSPSPGTRVSSPQVSQRLWYDSPAAAVLLIFLSGVVLEASTTVYSYFKKRSYQSRQAYLEGLRRQAQFQSERQEYLELYSGKSIEELAGIPDQYEIGPDGYPREKGAASGWGKTFTAYRSARGKCYHRERFCCSSYIPVHIFDTQQLSRLRPCSKCRPGNCEDFPWYKEYRKILEIQKKYEIN